MIKLDDKQIMQVKNILDTLIEATDHFSDLVKNRELNQSIFMFSSIVEGFESINNLLLSYKVETRKKERDKIEQYLLFIARELENGNFIKIAEIIQFSLSPQLRKLRDAFSTYTDTIEQKQIKIGVYMDSYDPLKAYPKERIHALIDAAEEQDVKLVFFSSNDVDLDRRTVNADIYKDGKWEKTTTSLPDIIHNIGSVSRAQQSIADRKLRRMIPFTSFFVGNKLYLPKKMVKYRKYAELLAFFRGVTDISVVIDFIDEHGRGVLKPILGRRGENIYFIEKKGNHYIVRDHNQERVFGKQTFEEWIQDVALKRKGSYMIQKYIESRTKQGEPFDFRAHMQKNGEGKWQITRIYPRIGQKKSILSNISRGGRTQNFDSFLQEEFGEKGKSYAKELRELSLNLSKHLDKLYGFALDELGLDLTIDKNGRFWLHEVNNGPQSTFHEKERAQNTIAYAIYLAKNGIVNTNEFQEMPDMKGQFNARATNLEWANLDDKTKIGMLVSGKEEEELAVACAYVANYEDVHFYVFRPNDIDFDEMLIRGKFYENKQWVEKVVEYPDVIYDRFRLRGVGRYNLVYQELDGIPFTNEFYGNSISKLEVYDKLKGSGKVDELIIPYQKVERVKDIFNYIDKYGKVILKPEVGSFAKGVHFISKEEDGSYFMVIGEKEENHSEFSLSNYLRDLLKKGTFIVQEYIETRTVDGQPFDIRVHMMKDEKGNWSFVIIYPRIGVNYATISAMIKGGYISNLTGFLQRNFGNEHCVKMEKHIEKISRKIADVFENLYDENMNELALDIAINKNREIFLIEINANKPGIVNVFDVAKHAIPYAKLLAKQAKQRK